MENYKNKPDKEPEPRDISEEFLTMRSVDFNGFLRTLRKEPALKIVITGDDVDADDWRPLALKGFLESPDALGKQKRLAVIRETEEQHERHIRNSGIANAFASAVKWEKI